MNTPAPAPAPHKQWVEADSLVPETPVHHFQVQSSTNQDGNIHRAQLSMYTSHFLSTWGARGWEFTVAILMLEIYPSSLLLVSIFGLVDAAVLTLGSPLVGTYVDNTPRLTAATRMYLMQNFSVAISAGSGLVLLWRGVDAPRTALYWIFVVLSISTGAISSLGATGASVSVEREWTKALSGNDSEQLAIMNSTMKRIDLTCLIVSPIFVGILLSWRIDAAVIALVAWNMISWLPECWLLQRAYNASPALSSSPSHTNSNNTSNNNSNSYNNNGQKSSSSLLHSILQPFYNLISGWRLYATQTAALAALSLALLYLTAMSFGTLMTAFLKWNGMKESELSIYRGLGALSGIAATFVFPFLHSRYSLTTIGVVAIWLQFSCLAIGSLPLLLHSTLMHNDTTTTTTIDTSNTTTTIDTSNTTNDTLSTTLSSRILVLGLIFSRFGLWGFDLAVNQIIQETVADGALGTVTGVQSSMQSLCQMLIYVAGVVVWQPERFYYLIGGSMCVVGSAAMLFSVYAIMQRRYRYRLMMVDDENEQVSFSP